MSTPKQKNGQTHMEWLEPFNRDLSFVPVTNDNPQELTREEISAYNESGYILPLDVLSPEKIRWYQDYFESLVERAMVEGQDNYSINGWHVLGLAIYDLAVNPRIVSFMRDLIGPDIVCWGTHYFCKLPGDGKEVSWHQDASYWPFDKSRTITVWLAITDSTRENGAMRVIPGTHLIGAQTTRLSEEDEHNVLLEVVPDVERFGDPVYFELKAGQISVHDNLLLHGSEPNRSSRPRGGLTLRYCPVDVRSLSDYHLGAVLVSGEDSSGHWGNVPRPTGADARGMQSESRIERPNLLEIVLSLFLSWGRPFL